MPVITPKGIYSFEEWAAMSKLPASPFLSAGSVESTADAATAEQSPAAVASSQASWSRSRSASPPRRAEPAAVAVPEPGPCGFDFQDLTSEEIGLEVAYNYPSDPPEKEDQGSPAACPKTSDAGETNHIHEIFYYARKLADQQAFVLDEQKFMDAIDEAPLCLRKERFL